MADSVTLPVAGSVPKKWLIGGAAVAGLYVAWAWWRSRSAGDAGYALDPSDGAVGPDDLGYDNPNPVQSGDGPAPDAAPTTNTEWATRVIARLSEYGNDPLWVTATIGRYLAGGQLDDSEANLVQQAWAVLGKPPTGPYVINKKPPTTGPTTPAPTPATAGKWFTIPKGYVKAMGTSAVMTRILADNGYSTSSADRSKVWYHPKNAALVAKYLSNWTKLNAGDTIWIPKK